MTVFYQDSPPDKKLSRSPDAWLKLKSVFNKIGKKMAWIKVAMNGKQYEALTHALIDIGFKPTSGKPNRDEIDFVWKKANRELKRDGRCIVNRNDNAYTITLGW